MKKTQLYVALSAILYAGNSASITLPPVVAGLGNLNIMAGSTIVANAIPGVTYGISSQHNDNYRVVPFNSLSGIDVNVSTDQKGVGVYAYQSLINLGKGSKVTVSGNGEENSTGLEAQNQALINAENLVINVASAGGAKGLEASDSASIVLSGERNEITVTGNDAVAYGVDASKSIVEIENARISALGSFSNLGVVISSGGRVSLMGDNNSVNSTGIGVYASGSGSVFNSNNLTVYAGNNGIYGQKDTRFNLQGKNIINSVGTGIYASGESSTGKKGAIFAIQQIHINQATDNTLYDSGAGLHAQNGGKISAGSGSSINADWLHGLYAQASVLHSDTTVVDYLGDTENRNSISVQRNSGVTAHNKNAIVNLSHTDINGHSLNGAVLGMRAMNGGQINAKNTSLIVSDKGTDNNSRGVQAYSQTGDNSVVRFEGETYLDASESKSGLALQAGIALTGGVRYGNGQIYMDGSGAIKGNLLAVGDGALINLNLDNGALLEGKSTVSYTEDAAINISLADSRWIMTDDSWVSLLSVDSGSHVYLNNGVDPDHFAQHTLTIKDNYSSHGGTLHFFGKLSGDATTIDRLHIQGNATGTSYVSVHDLGGTPAPMIEGKTLISVDGDYQSAQFIQQHRIVASAYEYFLTQQENTWYLSSYDPAGKESNDQPDTPDVPSIPEEPDFPANPEEPHEPGVPELPPSDMRSVLRPEAASYISNQMAANTLFTTRLHDRQGETLYIDPLTGETKLTSMWLRQVGGHNQWNDSQGQLRTQANRYVSQLGADFGRWRLSDEDSLRVGAMAGYAHQHSRSSSKVTGYRSTGNIKGYSTGVYGTWYQKERTKEAFYVDSWLQYSWFDNVVKGEGMAAEYYQSRGFTGSLETGFTHKLLEFMTRHENPQGWFIQPKAQIIWQGVSSKDHTEANGTQVRDRHTDNIQTRLGLRTFLRGHHEQDNVTGREFQPFVEANWIHNRHEFGTTMDSINVTPAGTRNVGELKTGVEGQITHNVNLWGNVGVQLGERGYQDTSIVLGTKVSF